MATKTVKAQSINQVASKTSVEKTDKILVSSSSGVVNSIELDNLTTLFGSGGSGGSDGSGGSSGSGGSGSMINVDLNAFNTGTFYAKTYEPTTNITCVDGTKAYSDEITITEDSAVYMTVYIQTTTGLAEGRFGIEFQDASGNWFPIKASFVRNSSDKSYEGSTELAIKVFNGSKFRAFVTNSSNVNKTTISSLTLYVTAIKGAAWSRYSRSTTLTISTAAPIDANNLLYVSPEASFNSGDYSPTVEFPEDYDGALIKVSGYFSLDGSFKASTDNARPQIYLQYCKPGDTTWVNFSIVTVPKTKTFCDFGTFYIERGSKIRLASNAIPTTASIHSPYKGCTATIQYFAINREEDDAKKANEENSELCILTDANSKLASPNSTVIDFSVPPITGKSQTQTKVIRFKDLRFSGESPVISWEPDVIQQIERNGIYYHQYGYGTNIGYNVAENTMKNYQISASDLTGLGISEIGKIDTKLSIDYIANMEKWHGLSGITSVRIGSTVQEIDSCCFTDLINISSIEIPETVQYIGGDKTFALTNEIVKKYKNLAKLEKVEFLGNGTTSCLDSVLAYTFHEQHKLSSLNLENLYGVLSVGTNAFEGTGLSSVNIPNGCTNLSWNAFKSMPKLSVVVIPSTITSVVDPTSRISGTYYHLQFVGVKLSAANSNYVGSLKDSTKELFLDQAKNELLNTAKYLSTVYDVNNTYKDGSKTGPYPDVKAIAFSNDGKLLTADINGDDNPKVLGISIAQPFQTGSIITYDVSGQKWENWPM